MIETPDAPKPYSSFPRDVTSPGPDQQLGVARSQRPGKSRDDSRSPASPGKREAPPKPLPKR